MIHRLQYLENTISSFLSNPQQTAHTIRLITFPLGTQFIIHMYPMFMKSLNFQSCTYSEFQLFTFFTLCYISSPCSRHTPQNTPKLTEIISTIHLQVIAESQEFTSTPSLLSKVLYLVHTTAGLPLSRTSFTIDQRLT